MEGQKRAFPPPADPPLLAEAAGKFSAPVESKREVWTEKDKEKFNTILASQASPNLKALFQHMELVYCSIDI